MQDCGSGTTAGEFVVVDHVDGAAMSQRLRGSDVGEVVITRLAFVVPFDQGVALAVSAPQGPVCSDEQRLDLARSGSDHRLLHRVDGRRSTGEERVASALLGGGGGRGDERAGSIGQFTVAALVGVAGDVAVDESCAARDPAEHGHDVVDAGEDEGTVRSRT